MPKRKRHDKLPSGWGSIRFLGKGRRLPYAVHPPATERNDLGFYIRPKAICYVPDWYTGLAVLSAYHAGTYTPGLEVTIAREVEQSSVDLDAFCLRVLKDRGLTSSVNTSNGYTFKEVYDQFIEWKFGQNAPRDLSKSAKSAYVQGYNLLSEIHKCNLDDLTVDRLQKIVNNCDKTVSTRQNILKTIKNVYKYALPRHMCKENVANAVVIPGGNECEKGVPFSDNDLTNLWSKVDDPAHEYMAEMILIMCHAGYRIAAWKEIKANLTAKTFSGGNKTSAGKNLVTPIHSDVLPLVERRIVRYGALIRVGVGNFRNQFKEYCTECGFETHTPHDTKHTFSRLCEKYGVRENDRKRMLGHSIGNITNDVYGHRDVEELRCEIEKIQTRQRDNDVKGNIQAYDK